MLEARKLGINDLTTTTYNSPDLNRSFLAGHVRSANVGGKQVAAPSLTTFADVQTAYAVAPGHCLFNPATGRKFELQNVTTNTPTVLCFNFDQITGKWTYVGKIIMTLPLGTHTYRGFDFDDTDSNNIKIFVSSTVTTALGLGGVFYTWGVALSDFTAGGTQIWTATGSNQKAVYAAQYAGQVGLGNLATTAGGVAHGRVLNGTAQKTRFYMQNGSAAAWQIYGWDTSLGNPSVDGSVVNGVSAATTAVAGTSPVAYFSMAAQNGYSTTANTAAQFETVALLAGTTAVPTGFTASPFGGAQTLYYMRDLQRLFTFNVTALTGTIVAGATFSNNGVTFTVNQAYAAGVTSIVAATPAGWNGTLPTASGTLALVANTGTQTAITFSSNTAGSWYFNLSATSTGVLIAPTSASAALTMVRGAGQSSTHSLLKTGTQSTALTGTILQAHSFGAAVPVSVPASAALNNADCLFISTSTNLYMGKVSDLVDGSVSFASLTGVNALGTTTDIVTPTIAFARYDGTIDRWVYVTNTSKFIMKPHQNNMISKIFGSPNIDYFEAQNPVSVQNGLAAIVSLNVVAGWAFITGSTTGQRGVVACDLRADDYFGFSYIISKVMKVPAGSLLRFFTTDEAYSLFTGDAIFYVRSGATATDPIFTTDLTSGWTQFQPYQDQGAVAIGPYFQVKIGSQILQDNSSCSPPQIGDVVVVYDSPGSIDDHWAWVGERTTQSGVSPMKVSTRLMYAHETTPSKFKLIGYDDSGNVVQTIDSSITPSAFAQSANNGTSYTTFTSMAAFMSGFNVAGGTTELAITISSPPAIPFVTWSFKYE